jgi:hypothetical protein
VYAVSLFYQKVDPGIKFLISLLWISLFAGLVFILERKELMTLLKKKKG